MDQEQKPTSDGTSEDRTLNNFFQQRKEDQERDGAANAAEFDERGRISESAQQLLYET